ncbi:hypothetical protein [Burkholderia sp. ISTR5]|uniref:hypothetical protein n=1 Tax=Burkholderia sp. ISTR5 TaxID=2500161 RepID=UPI00136F6B1D|nr:hypothetical protein [Burkholderia sp. ISTR5]NBI44312.1 hypothetical protein [Burkholderia sp. ISTR5]
MLDLALRTSRRAYLPADWPTLRGALARGDIDLSLIVCRLTLTAPDGEAWCIEDAMEPLALALCIDAPLRLLQGEDATVDIWNYPGEVRLAHDGQRIGIATVPARAAWFDKRELVDAMLDAGRRVVALMRELHAFDPAYAYRADPHFSERLEAAMRSRAARYNGS